MSISVNQNYSHKLIQISRIKLVRNVKCDRAKYKLKSEIKSTNRKITI